MNLKARAKFLLGIFIFTNLIFSIGVPSNTYSMYKYRNRTWQINMTSDDEDCMEDTPTVVHKRLATTTLIPLTPQEFFLAVQHNDYRTVEYLCNNSIDVNTQNPIGWTPLHYAVVCGNLPMVKFLVQRCYANVNLRDKNGLTPYALAINLKKSDIVDFLRPKRQLYSAWPTKIRLKK